MERKGSVGLDWLFRPRSVAIVGSAKGRTAGGEIPHSFLFLLSLKNMGFQGPVYVVSRSGSHHPSLEGQVFPSLLDIPGPVDHVIVCTPAAAVAEVLRECGEKGVRSAAIFSSGFGESEDPEGQKRQEDLARIAREAGVRLIGPNCMGLYCPETGLNFRADLPRAPGWTAMVSQSGGMAIRTIFQGVEKGLGFSKVVSYGNEVDLQSWELLEFLADDEPTRLILAYIEGTRDGRSLLRSIKKASSRKPVLVLKGGLCKEGSRAASSHTGSMAGNDRIWRSALRQAGAHIARDVSDLVDMAMTFSFLRRPAGSRVALVCISGGLIVNYADLIVGHGFQIPAFGRETVQALSEIVHDPGTSCGNPVDLASLFFNRQIYAPLFRCLDEDRDTDLILFVIAMEYVKALEVRYKVTLARLAEAFIQIVSGMKKPLVVAIPPVVEETSRLDVEKAFLKARIPTFITIDGALRSLAARIEDPRDDPAAASSP